MNLSLECVILYEPNYRHTKLCPDKPIKFWSHTRTLVPPPQKKMVPQYCKRMNGHSPSECWEVLCSQGMWSVKMAKRFHHIRRNTGIGWLFWENLSFHRSGTEIGRDSWPRK